MYLCLKGYLTSKQNKKVEFHQRTPNKHICTMENSSWLTESHGCSSKQTSFFIIADIPFLSLNHTSNQIAEPDWVSISM